MIARLEALVDTLSELEIDSAFFMHGWVKQADALARTKRVTYPWKPEHAERLVQEGFMGPAGVADPTITRGLTYTWAAILGFQSLAAEKDIPNLANSCALDFTHLPRSVSGCHQKMTRGKLQGSRSRCGCRATGSVAPHRGAFDSSTKSHAGAHQGEVGWVRKVPSRVIPQDGGREENQD
jgi:hypothetical protein